MRTNVTEDDIRRRVEELSPWFHSIDLPYGIRTKGLFEYPGWDMNRRVRSKIDYTGKSVLDIGSFDGMWAFEAEDLGASHVIATDCNWIAYEHFLFCREMRGSSVFPFYNVPVQHLVERLDSYWQGYNCTWAPGNKINISNPRFDIVQYMGVLYHLRDPLLAFLQIRSLMNPDGLMLLETACCKGNTSFMRYNWNPNGTTDFYEDQSTWWAPTMPCLYAMLRTSGFEPIESTVELLDNSDISRVAMACKAADIFPTELHYSFRNPGLQIIHA